MAARGGRALAPTGRRDSVEGAASHGLTLPVPAHWGPEGEDTLLLHKASLYKVRTNEPSYTLHYGPTGKPEPRNPCEDVARFYEQREGQGSGLSGEAAPWGPHYTLPASPGHDTLTGQPCPGRPLGLGLHLCAPRPPGAGQKERHRRRRPCQTQRARHLPSPRADPPLKRPVRGLRLPDSPAQRLVWEGDVRT